ncbi:MAG TPA: type I-U CRISPR-associated RAMP protein Csb1/Cas7u, partial [Beijerinckiaceae bacterium]|nr:type I-U CRISPR-associated RAMP protein Csb1/Cas7u [Beijerinckiaceae bacterium]
FHFKEIVMSDLNKYDNWLNTDTAAAIVIREPLVPVEGPDGVFFPATYAAAEDKKVFPGGYNIDPPFEDTTTTSVEIDKDGSKKITTETQPVQKNVCLVDSVGSQANRIEPLFAKPDYVALVPQIVITAGEKSVNLLEAGHRAGDAIVRCTPLQKKLQDAFKDVLKGNALSMAKIAPTSLVFGVWDSRDTQAKLPRLIASTIRAFDVQRLTRGAVYVPPLNYVNMDVFTEEEQQKAAGDSKNPLSKRGFVNALASASHGGVIAKGGIRRDVTFSLAALRLLAAGDDAKQTLLLRRYILGLSLVAITAPATTYLRQGCNLVPDIDHPRTFTLVNADGKRAEVKLTHQEAMDFARLAGEAFGVGALENVTFDPLLAKKDIAGEGDVAQTKKGRAQAKAKAAATVATEPKPEAQ